MALITAPLRIRLVMAGGVLITALTAFTLYLHTQISGDWVGELVLFTAIVPAPLVAGVLISLRSANVIGYLLLGHAFMLALIGLTGPYAQYGLVDEPGSLPGARWVALAGEAGWPALYAGLVAIALGFPDGRLPSRRWRAVAAGAAVSFAGLVLVLAFAPGPLSDPFAAVDRPVPTLPEALEWLVAPFWLGTLASLFAAAWAARVRLRRAAGHERRQLLWLAYGALSIPAALVVCALDFALNGEATLMTGVAVMTMELTIPSRSGSRSCATGCSTSSSSSAGRWSTGSSRRASSRSTSASSEGSAP